MGMEMLYPDRQRQTARGYENDFMILWLRNFHSYSPKIYDHYFELPFRTSDNKRNEMFEYSTKLKQPKLCR